MDALPIDQWTSKGAFTFLPWSTNDVTPANDPSKVQLKKPYVVSIIGASRGIGAHIAYSYVKAGASGLVLSSRRVSGLEETAAECRKLNPKIEIEIVSCDISSKESVASLAEKTAQRFDRLDVVVVNSGVSGPAASVVDDDLEMVKMDMDVNYAGTFYAAKYHIPLLLNTEGGAKDFIGINTGASMVIRGPVANAKYCVSKLAQVRLLEMIHEQFHREGLGAYALHPGAVVTEMSTADAPESFRDALVDSIDLAGAWCVWLTKNAEQKWLSGRWMSVNWPVEDLVAKKDEIIERDLAKMVLAI